MQLTSTFPSVLFGVVAFVSTPFHAVLALSPQEVGTIAQAVTVRIDGARSGSGVLIEKNGSQYTVLTTAHVVEATAQYSLQTNDEQRYPIDLNRIQKLPTLDLALVEFESDQDYAVVEIGDASQVQSGTSIFVAGFPAPTLALTERVFNLTDGTVMANGSRSLDQGYSLAYNNNTLPGMSGGAVLNEAGQLIGIHGRSDQDNEVQIADSIYQKSNFNLAIPINTFLQVAKSSPSAPALQSPELTADDWFLQAGDAFQQQRYRIAIAAFDKAIQLNPFGFAYSNRGIAKSRIGDIQGAIADFSQALKQTPADAIAYSNRGVARMSLGERKEAMADYNTALQLDPEYVMAYYNRGNLKGEMMDWPGAIADYDTVLRLDPNFAAAYYNRGVMRQSQGDVQGAIADFDQAIEVKPDYSAAYNNRGSIRRQLGNPQGAMADYNKAIQLDPDVAEGYYNRGVLRGPMGDIQGAIADLNQAIQLNPEYAEAYANRGIARSQTGDAVGEMADYNRAIEINPDYALAYYNRAAARVERGDQKGAIADYTTAARLFKAQGQDRNYQAAIAQLQRLAR